MIFREYHKGDYPGLSALWQSLGMGGPERDDSEASILKTIELGGRLIVLEDRQTGKIIGSSWMTFDGRRIYLHHFGIHNDYQGRGYGTKLAYESLKHIKKEGFQVKLEVHKENNIAKHLYEKLGFGSFTDYDIYMIRKPFEINYPDVVSVAD